eukprot:4916963-Amphidinium_carterae.2
MSMSWLHDCRSKSILEVEAVPRSLGCTCHDSAKVKPTATDHFKSKQAGFNTFYGELLGRIA